MRKVNISDKQIEICNIILTSNQKKYRDVFPLSEDTGEGKFKKSDLIYAGDFLTEKNLATVEIVIHVSDLGLKYSDKGILKFIKNKRRDDCLNSPLFKTWVLVIPIIFSLGFSILNYCQNKENKRNDSGYVKKAEIDSIIDKKCLKNSFRP